MLPSLVIFFSFPKLRTLRIALHRNLILAIIIKNILTIMSKNIVILDSLKPLNETKNVMNENSIECRVLAFFENVSKNVIFTCMLVDGFYLHKLIVRIFAPEPNKNYLYSFTIGKIFIYY